MKATKILPTSKASPYRVPQLNLAHLAMLSSDALVPASFTQAYKGDEGLSTQTCQYFQRPRKEVNGRPDGLQSLLKRPKSLPVCFQGFSGSLQVVFGFLTHTE